MYLYLEFNPIRFIRKKQGIIATWLQHIFDLIIIMFHLGTFHYSFLRNKIRKNVRIIE